MGWFWYNSNTNTHFQLLSRSATDAEGFYGRTKKYCWQVWMFSALTDFSLPGVQSSRHNQEDVMTTEELYELHTYPLKAEAHTHMYTRPGHPLRAESLYVLQTDWGTVCWGKWGATGDRDTKNVCANGKWGSQLRGVKSGPGCSSCVRHTHKPSHTPNKITLTHFLL